MPMTDRLNVLVVVLEGARADHVSVLRLRARDDAVPRCARPRRRSLPEHDRDCAGNAVVARGAVHGRALGDARCHRREPVSLVAPQVPAGVSQGGWIPHGGVLHQPVGEPGDRLRTRVRRLLHAAARQRPGSAGAALRAPRQRSDPAPRGRRRAAYQRRGEALAGGRRPAVLCLRAFQRDAPAVSATAAVRPHVPAEKRWHRARALRESRRQQAPRRSGRDERGGLRHLDRSVRWRIALRRPSSQRDCGFPAGA